MGNRPDELRTDVDRICSGAEPPSNGLEERLDMLIAQLSVIAYELHRMNDARRDT